MKHQSPPSYKLFLPAAVLLVGLLFSGLASWLLVRGINLDAESQFHRMSSRTATEIETRFNLPLYGLRGTRSALIADQQVTRADFRAVIESRNLTQEFPGVRGIGFVERVETKELDSFQQRERADGAPNFQVRQLEDKSHSDLFVIKYLEPMERNRAALGLDLGSEAVRRSAVVQAVDTGQPIASGAVTLVQDQKQTPGILLFLPVYRRGSDLSVTQGRRAALKGLVYAPIVIAELMHNLQDVESGLLEFQIFDSARSEPQGALIYDAALSALVPPQGAIASTHAGPRFHSTQELFLPGREWTLRLASTPRYDASISYMICWLMLGSGTVVSILLAFVIRQQALARAKAEALAGSMTEDLSLLAEVVKHTDNAVSIADIQGRITWVNDGFTRITGYTLAEAAWRTPEELLGSGKADPALLKRLSDAAASASSCRVEILNRAKGGREYWTDTEIQPRYDAQGQHVGFMEIGIDVTKQRLLRSRLETTMRDNDALLGTMNQHAIISTADSAGLITEVNDAFCDISGYRREELIGHNHRVEDSGTHTADYWANMWATIASGASWRGEICNRAKDGRLYWVDTFIAPFVGDDGQIEKYISIRIDISQSKEAQASALRNADLLLGAIEAIDEAFVLYDPQDRLVLCNEKYRQTYKEVAHLMVPGARFEDIVRTGAELGEYSAAIGRVDEWVAERVAAHQSANTSLIQKLANGRTLRIIERKLANGHIVGFRIDITELVLVTEAAQAASQSKSQFLANMSHEIRTPMNAILGMLTLLRKTSLTAQQADYASKSEGAARALMGLINEILDFSKIEAGKMTLEAHPFSLDELLRDLSVLLSASAGAKPVEVLYDIDPAVPTHLVGDAMRIQQVLLNLGSNGIKFTAEGEVVLAIKLVHRSNDAVTLQWSLRDTGIGIAPENQARIFSGFTQAESSTTRRFGGTGLGVAISQRFVAMMGGELELQSAVGSGSLFYFTITLPVATPPSLALPAAPSQANAHPHVLLLHHHPVARQLLHRSALSAGWRAEWAETMDEATRMLLPTAEKGAPPVEGFDVVFVDTKVAAGQGWQAYRQLQAHPGMAGVRFVLMATAHERDILSGFDGGATALADGILAKPASRAMLQEAMADATSPKSTLDDAAAGSAVSSQKRLHHMRLLVVEDNANNQQVARELLECEGASVQLADNGQAGVQAVADAALPFDVVLMDLQMPVMDGLTATRTIRTVLGDTQVPIVAMTANAMASDRAACLAAGMNDHVGKPFDLDDLVRVLRKQARWNDLSEVQEPRAAGVSPALARTGSDTGIDLESAVQRLGGNQNLYHRMLVTFVNDLGTMKTQLQACTQVDHAAEGKRLLHTLKGLAATLGSSAMSRQMAQLEKQLGQQTTAQTLQQVALKATLSIDEALPGLSAMCAALALDAAAAAGAATGLGAGSPPAALDAARAIPALQALAQLLRNGDMEAMQALADIQREFGTAGDEPLEALAAAMTELDFDAALPLCNALIEKLHG